MCLLSKALEPDKEIPGWKCNFDSSFVVGPHSCC